MDLRILGNAVSKRPLATLIVILLITSAFGFYAAQMNMNADLHSFLPDDDVVRAQEKISDEFGDTDIMQVILISDNAVSKESMENMLTIEKALVENETVRENLKNPDNPGESITSPADIVVMGNITLKFERGLIEAMREMRGNLSGVNFTAMLVPISTMTSVMDDYRDIYENATLIRDDAKVVVLLMFSMPTNSTGNESMGEMMPLLENVSAALVYGEDFNIKAKFLTLLTPPLSSGGGGGMEENPLMDYFVGDMGSNMSIGEKEVSVRNLIRSNEFSYYNLNYSNSSLSEGIEGNNQTIGALNYVKNLVLMGNNATAKGMMDTMISNLTERIEGMEYVLPYYVDYNRSLSTFLYHLQTNSVTLEDVASVEENTSRMISVASGDFLQMLLIFNDTFHAWLSHNHIYYDVAYQANMTRMLCEGFVQTHDSMVQLNYSFTAIRNMIDHDTVDNTTAMIDNVVSGLQGANEQMEEQLAHVQEAMNAMNSPYFQWFSQMLDDLDYLLLHSRIAANAVNVFNIEMEMMSNPPSGGSPSMEQFQVYYALKHAFTTNVADSYKYKIQDMYLREMSLASMVSGIDMNMSFEGPELEVPDFSPSVEEKQRILGNMTQEDIFRTIEDIENYDAAPLNEEINATMPVIENVSGEMENFSLALGRMLDRMEFVYNTTSDPGVEESMGMWMNISSGIENASVGLRYFRENVAYISGFSYMMDQLSLQFRNMFSKDYDGRSAEAAIMIVILNNTYLPGESSDEHSDRMERLESTVEAVAKESSTHGEVRVMGTYLISKATEKTANETMNVLMPVAMILVIVILLVTFRSVLDTVLGLLGLGMAIAWAYGFGVLAGYDFNQISTTVAVLLIGLGIDYAIHTILRYREELRKGRSVRDAMNEMITNLGMGLVLATVTTIAAFLSNLSSPIPPVQSFGVMNAVGIFGAFVIFTTFVPAVKILIDERRDKKGKLKIREVKKEGSGISALNNFLALGAIGAERHRYTVLLVIILITGAAAYAGMNVDTTFDLKDFLPSNLEISDTITYLMDNFNASEMNDNYILVEGNITDGAVIKAVDETMKNMEDDSYVDVAQSTSVISMIREWSEKNASFARMVAENDTDGDGLPDGNITAIYDWLYENANGKSILHRENGTYDSMLIIVRSSASTDRENRVLVEEVNEDIKPLEDIGLKATLTGTNILTFHILDLLGGSQWTSLIITIIVSLIVLTVVFYYEARSLILGLITSLPVVLALIWLLGTMYALGIGFNVVTVTITSLTIGLGITYAIHITHRFLEDSRREKDIVAAVRKTVVHTGSSIFGAATTTMAGFGTLMLSSMPPIAEFGEIATLSILYSFVLSVFVLPSFLYIWAEWRDRKMITEENREKYGKIGASILAVGVAVYFLAYYLRWVGWKIVQYPPSLLPAVIGVAVIIAGLEVYYRANGKI